MQAGRALKGAEGFDHYYGSLFGDRWHSLRKALSTAGPKVLRTNAFASREVRESDTRGLHPLDEVPGCYLLPEPRTKVVLSSDAGALLSGYVMDAASVVAARTLDVQPNENVLDLCAAPGGKSLVLLEALGDSGRLTLNDRSRRRAARLRAVLQQYAPEAMRKRVVVTTHDACRWGLYRPAEYDALLLDAPCSSERHVLGDGAELGKWSVARVRRLAIDQYAMLASAVTSLKPGGRVVYCTCSLTPAENDDVVRRLVVKQRQGVRVAEVSAPFGERTEFGWQIHPDLHGAGPIYFAKVIRTP